MIGALIFAFNNERIDYVKMAAWSAGNIRRHLGLPVAVVTDSAAVPDAFDHVIRCTAEPGNIKWYDDLQQSVTWYNGSRTDALALSPWDVTLVIDADYVVASDALKPLVQDLPCDFLCFRHAHSVGYGSYDQLQPVFGTTNFPMWWATVMIFRRSAASSMIFDSMAVIKRHWQHFRDLYGIQQKTYRNDYALSIAAALESGHALKVNSIPWSMPSVLPDHDIVCNDVDSYEVTWTATDGQRKRVVTRNQDLHVMCKSRLGDIVAAH